MEDAILAIDLGTQSVRALVFDLKGMLIAKSQVVLQPYFSEKPGWAEQDPDYFWKSLCEACQGLWRNQKVNKGAIRGVALTTQRGTVVNVDKQDKPLRPAILWLDQRRAEKVPPLPSIWRALFSLMGISGTIDFFERQAEANWIHLHQPEIEEKTHKYLLVSGYLTYRLTGEYVDSVGCQVGYLPFDFKKQRWASFWDWKWKAIAVRKEALPILHPPGELLGEISKGAARDTGVPAGLPMIAAAADKACEVLGSGCITPEVACLSYGTTATLNVTSSRYQEPIRFLPPYPSAVPGHYNLEVQIFRGYWMVSWFKQQFGFKEEQLALERGVSPESFFDELVNQVPPGSMGLILQPYWTPGVRVPGPEAKGAVIGFGDVHTRAHIYRAILEGLAYALREGNERIEQRTKVPIQSLRVSGGGSQSNAAMQLTADLFNLPAARPHVYEASGLGAAINAAVGLKLHSDIHTALSEMTRIAEVFEPNPHTRDLYEALYQRVYKKMYRHLKGLYREIQAITGYPE